MLNEIDAPLASVTADAMYDASSVYEAIQDHRDGPSTRILIPPKKGALIDPESDILKERNRKIRSGSRCEKREWHKASGYAKRSKVETVFSRYKGIPGSAMRARNLAAQRVEGRIGAKILNKMAAPGMPNSHMLG